MVPLVHPVTGWELVVYDPVVAESRLRGNEAKLVEESQGFDLEHMGYDFINEDAEDSNEDERVVPERVSELVEESDEPKKKKLKKNMTLVERYENFLHKFVVRGKLVKVSYFQEPGLGVFVETLEAQGWLELFTDPKRGCSVPYFAEFYANCVATNQVVTSIVNGHEVQFDAKKLVELLVVSSEGFDVYVREDKSILGEERLLALTQRLAQKPHLTVSRSMRKGETMPLHRLFFWLVITNVVP